VLDRDIGTCHHDPLHQQADQSLTPGEVELAHPLPQRRRKRREILADALQTGGILVFGGLLLAAESILLSRLLDSRAPRLELFDAHRALLVCIEEPLQLPLELAPLRLQTPALLIPPAVIAPARAPRLDLTREHRGVFEPRRERLPDDRIQPLGADAVSTTPLGAAGIDRTTAVTAVVEVLVPLADTLLPHALHPPSALAADDQRP
jgi:hypothetical protein